MIALCEGDDYWTDPFKLQKQVDFLESNPGCGLVYSDVDFFFENSKTFKKAVFENNTIYRTKSFEDHLINKGYLAPCTWVFRKECIANIDVKSIDASFVMMLEILKDHQVHFLNEVTAVYRVNQSSASRNIDPQKNFIYLKGIFQIQKDYCEKYNVSEKTSHIIYLNTYLKLLKDAMLINDKDFIEEARQYFTSQQLEFTYLQEQFEKMLVLESENEKLKQSKAYKTGKTLLKPLSISKKLLSTK